MKQFLILVSSLILSSTLFGQNILRGQIVDEEGVGISTVTIQTNDDQTISDKSGFFSVNIKLDSTLLVISHVAYEKRKLWASLNTLDTVIKIVLYKKIHELDSVTVSEKRVQQFVEDFEISNGIVYKLIRRKKSKVIQATNIPGTFLLEKKVAKDINEILLDCFGNIHLRDEVNVYQIECVNDEIIDVAFVSLKEFTQKLDPCQLSINQNIVWAKYYEHGQHLKIDLFSNREVINIANIWDKESSRVASDYYNEIIRDYYANTPIQQNIIEQGVWDGDLVKLSVPKKVVTTTGNSVQTRVAYTVQTIDWYQTVAAKPIYCPIFNYGDSVLFLFDFFDEQLFRYSNLGEQTKAVNVAFQLEKGWSELILFDEVFGLFYSVRQSKGTYWLGEIDMDKGVIYNSIPVKKMVDTKNLRVYGGKVYFIYNYKLYSNLLY